MNTPTTHPTSLKPFDNDAFEYIVSQKRWQEVATILSKQPVIAFDLESNGYHRYPDRICLIQIASATHVYLIDPTQVLDLSELGKLLKQSKIIKIFHSCENDLRALDRDFGFRVKNIFDTAVAAHFLGAAKRGLSNVLIDFMEIALPKSKTLQRQDWSMRPLSKRSLQYAAGDVALLIELRTILIKKLKKLGRLGWVEEENKWLEKIKADAPQLMENLFWSVRGCKDLGDQQRAILKELVIYRDQLCRELDRTPFRVLGDDVLLMLARKPDCELKAVNGLAVIFHQKQQKKLRQAILRGKRSKPISLPPKKNNGMYKRKGEHYTSNLKRLKKWRIDKGAVLSLDPALLWPLSSLELLSADVRFEKATTGVRQWQHQSFEKEITALLDSQENKRDAAMAKKD